MSGKDYQEYFLRQRRNLMGLSAFIIAINASGATLDKINVFGNEVVIYRHEWVVFMLCATLVYFLLRYCQYYWHLDSPAIGYISERCDRVLARTVVKAQLKKSDSFRSDFGSIKNIRFSSIHRMSNSLFTGGFKIGITGKNGGPVISMNFTSPSIFRRLADLMLGTLWASLTTRVFTEYLFPLVLAIIGLASFIMRVELPYMCMT